jgi:hypothetical protein
MTWAGWRHLVAGWCWCWCGALWPAMAQDVLTPVAIGFHVPVVRDVPRRDVELSLRFWVEEIGDSLNLKYKPVRMYDDMADLKRDMLAGDINFVVGNAMAVAQTFSDAELRDGFTGAKHRPEHLLLVVRREAGITGPAQLRGKRVVLLDQDALSDAHLQALLGPNGIWGKVSVSREKRSQQLVHRLFFNQADATLITRNAFETAVELNPQIGQHLQVLDAHSFKGRTLTVGLFSSKVSPADAQAITEAAMKLQNTVRGRQILDIFQSDAVSPSRVTDLAPYRTLLARQQALSPAGAQPNKGP